MRLLLTVALALTSLLPLVAEEPKSPTSAPLIIHRPDGIDEAAWARFKATHAALIQDYLDGK